MNHPPMSLHPQSKTGLSNMQYSFPTGDEGVARPVSTVSADGTIYSSFDLDQLFQVSDPVTGNQETTDFVGEVYHLLLAVGEMGESSLVPEAGEVPKKHFLKFASFNPILFVTEANSNPTN